MPVPLPALEQVLEEIHRERRASLREWQELRIHREQRSHHYLFPDEAGKDLERLSRVHSSWTPIAREVLGRILLLQSVTERSARAAVSSPTFGLWTYEIYLSFPREGYFRDYSDILDDAPICQWGSIERILARTPAVTSICLQTASESNHAIDVLTRLLSSVLHMFKELRSLRLYSDVNHGPGTGRLHLDIKEIPELFLALQNCPHFEFLTLRNLLPCYAFVSDERIKRPRDTITLRMPRYIWLPNTPPDPQAICNLVGESTPLTGRARNLAEFIRSICNTPTEITERNVVSMGNCMTYASLRFDLATRQFTINAARIATPPNYPPPDLRPETFPKPEWCEDMEFLDIYSNFDVLHNLYPYPSLKFLRIFFSSSQMAPYYRLVDEIGWFIESLPLALEVLDVNFYWEVPKENRILPVELHAEIDELLESIPINRCPRLKLLLVKLDGVSELFRTTEPLTQLIQACEKQRVPLVLHKPEFEIRHGFDSDDEEELNRIAKFENHLLSL